MEGWNPPVPLLSARCDQILREGSDGISAAGEGTLSLIQKYAHIAVIGVG